MEEIQDRVLHSSLLPVGKLEWVLSLLHLCPQVVHYQSLQRLHYLRGEGDGAEVVGDPWLFYLGDRNNAGSLPQRGDFPQVQTQVEDIAEEGRQAPQHRLSEAFGSPEQDQLLSWG